VIVATAGAQLSRQPAVSLTAFTTSELFVSAPHNFLAALRYVADIVVRV
jgi:hypothetical protein